MDFASQIVTLSDDQRIGYASYGEPEGTPVFFFHGWPNSRLEAGFGHQGALKASVHLIGIDRPGYGLSDPQPGRSLLNWPLTVREIADILDIKRFAVVGLSGGAPYAVACASCIPERLLGVALVSGLGPLDGSMVDDNIPFHIEIGISLIRKYPSLTKPILRTLSSYIRRSPQSFLRQLRKIPGPDGELYSDTEMANLRLSTFMEGSRQGVNAWVEDLNIYSNNWGISLEDINLHIQLWHGEDDARISLRMARNLERLLPNCQSYFLKNEGHVSLIVNHMDTILGKLLQ
jgi:pimeloyl-ACP methyl ester carboxylesterase